MPTLLKIDCSPQLSKSRTRILTQFFDDLWRKKSDGHCVVRRDLAKEPVPFVTEGWVEAAYKDPATRTDEDNQHLAYSDRIIGEFLAADVIVFGVPMHNLGVSAVFKAYLDQFILNGRTLGPHGKPMIIGKRVYVITSRGGQYRPGTPTAHYDLQEPYIKTVLSMIGLGDVHLINVEGQIPASPIDEKTLANARKEIEQIVSSLTL